MPRQTDGSGLLHEQLIASTGDRGHGDPLAGYFSSQRVQRPANRPGRARRILEVPVAGEANGMKLRKLSDRGDWRFAFG